MIPLANNIVLSEWAIKRRRSIKEEEKDEQEEGAKIKRK